MVSPSARAQPSSDAATMPCPYVRDGDDAHRLIPSHPECECAFLGEDRHASEQFARGRRDDRDDHHRKDEARGEQTLSLTNRPLEERNHVADRGERREHVR